MVEAYTFSSTILREYDIRGKVGDDLTNQDAYMIGCAFGSYVREDGGRKICVGYDGRESSPIFAKELIRGLNDVGIDVENIGLGPTPMLYFSVKDRMADAGVMITGSHNPPEYNGFKMMMQNKIVYGQTIQDIGLIAATGGIKTPENKGSYREIDVKEAYVARMLRDLDVSKDYKIAWDCGNGAAGEIVQMLTAKLPGEHILLFEDIDGTFPNHHPDPTVKKNLKDLIDTVLSEKCDLGVAFDGDGDRIGAVDEKGQFIPCDKLIAIYAKEILEEHPYAPIIADVKCSQTLFDEIARLKGEPVMWKCGHSLVKAKMAETKAPLAGELSGHIFFADKWYGFDDGIYSALRLMNALNESDDVASALTAHIPETFVTEEIRFEVDEAEKFDLAERIASNIRKKYDNDNAEGEDKVTIIDIDGIRVTLPYGWWLMRPSNTQNVLVTRAEAKDAASLEKIKEMIQTEVNAIGYSVDFEE